MGVTRKQSSQNFLIKKHFLPPDTKCKKCLSFRKSGELFSLNTRFEIHPFALLPTKFKSVTSNYQFSYPIMIGTKTQFFKYVYIYLYSMRQ